jgi:indole-3-glycerol phosphate synthase
MTVSTVEWSVADKIASPTSFFEGYMWDKETEVDRFRERVPLSNLVSQCRLSSSDPSKPKPRDWFGPVKNAAKDGSFVIIPECKRMEPGTGSLRKRYDIEKLTKEFTVAGVPAISVNCDGILFGGSLEDITKARDGTTKAATESLPLEQSVTVPPILASDLLLYPYQLYQLRLAGADAVNLMVAALEAKDLVYLVKIAASLQMQTFATVTSIKQIQNLNILPAGSVKGLIVSNRNLEDFSFDMTGQQALDILTSQAMMEFREKHGNDNIAILAEGRVGLITGGEGASPQDYINKLQEAGTIGAIVGTGLVPDESKRSPLANLLLRR